MEVGKEGVSEIEGEKERQRDGERGTERKREASDRERETKKGERGEKIGKR